MAGWSPLFRHKSKTYLIYLFFFLITIPAVISLFRQIPDRKLASVFASLLFISVSLGPIIAEVRSRHFRSLTLYSALLFLIIFALPMFLTRLLNYDVDFSLLKVWGLDAPAFHKLSNYGFLLMALSSSVDFVRFRKLNQR